MYEHQKEAVNAVVREHKNLVVCTGTGSGKTESFLIPLFDALIKEREEERRSGRAHTPGVRALILYPMNALVNGQARRIRHVLKIAERMGNENPAKDISFGIYTGQLALVEETAALAGPSIDALVAMKSAPSVQLDHPYLGEDVKAKNELAKRSDWNKKPADILITNYAMLERLMLDPDKDNFFGPTWRFIILDEAHTYDGALGSEIAWLIRRLVQRTRSERMTYMATSATLVSDEDPEAAARKIRDNFASQLFPAPADTFAVLFGKLKSGRSWGSPAKDADAARYEEIVSSDGYHGEGMDASLCNAVSGYTGDLFQKSLLQQTLWLFGQKSALSRFDYLSENADKAEMGFGDAVVMAEQYYYFASDHPLGLDVRNQMLILRTTRQANISRL